MVYTKKVGFKKVNKRTFTKGKKTPLTKPETRAVAKIAKKVLMSNVEHKYQVVGIEDTVFRCQNIYAINPMGVIVYGTSEGARIGEQINNVVLRFKLAYYNLGWKNDLTDIKLWNKSKLRVVVVKTKRQLTNNATTWTDITTSIGRTDSTAARDGCLFYQPTGWAWPYHSGMADIRRDNDFKVLLDTSISSSGEQTSETIAGNLQNGKFNELKFMLKLGKFEYEESNVAYARKGSENIYVLAMPWIPRSIAGTDFAGDITAHYSLSWTDA